MGGRHSQPASYHEQSSPATKFEHLSQQFGRPLSTLPAAALAARAANAAFWVVLIVLMLMLCNVRCSPKPGAPNERRDVETERSGRVVGALKREFGQQCDMVRLGRTLSR